MTGSALEGSPPGGKAPLELSKLEAARRQLETVIQLFFSNGDEVAIHTLSAAAYNVICDIVKKKKIGPMIVKDMAVEHAKPEFRELVRKSLNKAENFFKHPDKDPNATLKFFPAQTEYLIFDAEVMHQKLTGKVSAILLAFRGWFTLTHQNIFKFSAEGMKLVEGSQRRWFRKVAPSTLPKCYRFAHL